MERAPYPTYGRTNSELVKKIRDLEKETEELNKALRVAEAERDEWKCKYGLMLTGQRPY